MMNQAKPKVAPSASAVAPESRTTVEAAEVILRRGSPPSGQRKLARGCREGFPKPRCGNSDDASERLPSVPPTTGTAFSARLPLENS